MRGMGVTLQVVHQDGRPDIKIIKPPLLMMANSQCVHAQLHTTAV